MDITKKDSDVLIKKLNDDIDNLNGQITKIRDDFNCDKLNADNLIKEKGKSF